MLTETEVQEIYKRAENGNARALMRLAHWHDVGSYAPQDRHKAKYYFTKLVNLGANPVNEMEAILDYFDFLTNLAYMHFNDGEILLAKKYLTLAKEYVLDNYPPSDAENKLEEERVDSLLKRIDRVIERYETTGYLHPDVNLATEFEAL